MKLKKKNSGSKKWETEDSSIDFHLILYIGQLI